MGKYLRQHSTLWLLAALVLLPFAYLLLLSLSTQWRYPALWPPTLTGMQWQQLFNLDPALLRILMRSIVLSTTVALLATTAGFFTSKAIATHARKRLWLGLAYVPFALSPVIYAVSLVYFFIELNLYANLPGVIVAQLIIVYPYCVILLSSHWGRHLLAMEQLVFTLGGSRRQALVRALWPASKRALQVCFFQAFLISWFEYGLTSFIGLGQVTTLTLQVYQYVQEANPYMAAVAACLIVLPPLGLLYLNKRFLFKRV